MIYQKSWIYFNKKVAFGTMYISKAGKGNYKSASLNGKIKFAFIYKQNLSTLKQPKITSFSSDIIS